MHLTKLAGFLACTAGLVLTASSLHAEPLFSYLDPATDGIMATTTAPALPAPEAAISVRTETATNVNAAIGLAMGTWTTVVTASTALPSAPMALTTAKLREPQPRATAALPGPRLTGAGHSLSGIASYYWQEQMTATGERFNKRDLTAAHKTLPFGTRVRVTRLDTGANVVVRINDRGPFKPGRVIDLSERAAEDIGMTGRGLTAVRLEVLGR